MTDKIDKVLSKIDELKNKPQKEIQHRIKRIDKFLADPNLGESMREHLKKVKKKVEQRPDEYINEQIQRRQKRADELNKMRERRGINGG